ncbi:MAG: site-specific integrase [Dermatophilaceae bacterium]
MLGLTWSMVNLDASELEIRYGLQRIGGRLVHGETKTQASDALLTLRDICVTALRFSDRIDAAALRRCAADSTPRDW